MEIETIFQLIRLGKNQEYRSLKGKFDVNQTNSDYQNLLHEAVSYHNNEIITDLITDGIDMNHQDNMGQTPLHYAVANNNPAAVIRLIDNGANVSICDQYGNNALWTATFNARGNYKIVTVIKEAGGNPANKNKHGKSPIDFAIQIGDQELIRILEGSYSN